MLVAQPCKTDRKEIEALFRETITHTFQINKINHSEDIEKEIASQMKCLDDALSSNDQSITYLIAKEKGLIVGTIASGPANNDLQFQLPEASGLAELRSIYILPAYQGLGIGTQLIQSMLLILHDLDKPAFVLDSGYKSAQEIWIHRFGSPIIELKNHWEDQSSYMIWKISLEVLSCT